jgi:hypothetical protein
MAERRRQVSSLLAPLNHPPFAMLALVGRGAMTR